MAWTKQQSDAIKIRDSSVIVSAAAGSGKTAVLTERLVQLISDENSGIRADRIIVVTFTNDAASELRKRLDYKLRDMIFNDPGNKHLLKQQTLLQNAKISTINSFCFEILRDNITEQGITSSFSVIDESENNLIKSQSMDELLNYFSSMEYEKISYLYDKFCLKDDKNLSEVINLADRYLSSSAMRDKWLDDAVEAFNVSVPMESLYCHKLVHASLNKLYRAMKLSDQRLDMFDDIFDDMEKKSAVKYMSQAKDDIARIKNAVDILENGKIPESDEIKSLVNFGNLSVVRRGEGINSEVLEMCSAKRRKAVKLAEEAVNAFTRFSEDFEESRKVTVILAEMIKKYHELIWEKKCEKNALSFDDGERLVLDLLADIDDDGRIIQTETACRIADFYDLIMIDEYQDSNNKQDLIFKLISKNYQSNDNMLPMYGSNAFLVGDVKQSIYKFRLANPQNFINTIKNSEPYDEGTDSKNVSIFLNKNFRSSDKVIDFVNFIFSNVMSESCGDIKYNENEQLYFGASEYENAQNEQDYITSIAFIESDASNENDNEESNDSEKRISNKDVNVEAVYTAKKIYSMIENQHQTVMKDGKTRPCEPSDFCILIRKNKYAKDFINELQKLGIEAKGEEEKGYLSSNEITILLDLLRIIDNPLLDVSTASVMMSPMYMFEFEEIAYLKTLDKKLHIFTILSNVVSNTYSNVNDEFFIERCRNFLNDLSRFRLLSVTMTVGELIGTIYDDTDFITVMQLYTDGEKKRANLRALIQYAKNYEASSSFENTGGLSGFVRYIDRIIENGADFPQGKISASSGNYVAVKTIHKSKGLEYPFVFLAETSSVFKKDTPPVIFSDDGRIGYVLYDQKLVRRYRTSAYNQIIEENNKDILSEEMRLLYVALTRAKQKIFINIKYNENKLKSFKKLIGEYYAENENISELASYAKCHADWIIMSLFEHEKFSEIAEKIGLMSEDCNIPEVKCTSSIFETVYPKYNISENVIEKIKDEFKEELPDPKLCSELKEIINYDYDETLSKMPSKMSVTQIIKKMKGGEEKFNFTLKRPRFTEEIKKLTGAEMGTAIHTFFQYCDFEKASSEYENEISLMICKGYLSPAQADSINRENVNAFFDSKLYQRIKNSDKVYREKKFMVAVADLEIDNSLTNVFKQADGMIKGIVDLAFEENGKLIIVDYKSDRGASAEILKLRYETQLKLYKSALELTLGKEVAELYLYSFELRCEIKIDDFR